MNTHRIALLAAAISLMLAARPAFALQTDTHGMHAMPVPGAVAIDGDLKDWDLSGQTLMCYDVATLRDTNSADVAMMYDKDNFYVAFHFKTPNPMRNHHDPRYQANKGWAADSVQLRIRTDRIAHVTAWNYVDKSEPTIQISYGTDAKPFGGASIQLMQTSGWKLEQGAEMAFKRDVDGKGYVQEMKLPWAILAENKKYNPGEVLNCGVEMLWGGTDWPDMRYADNLAPGVSSREFFWSSVRNWGSVTLEPKGHIKLPTPDWQIALAKVTGPVKGPIPVTYSLQRDGDVTIAIDDAQGNRVRNLLPPSPRKKGANTEYWDGKDDAGFVVEAGTYNVKGIVHDPIRLKYGMSFANPGNPTWSTPDGTGAFYADHTAPSSVAAAGDKIALACPLGEAGPALIVCDSNAQRLWGQSNRVFAADVITSLATDGKTLWAASDGNKAIIYRNELATGLFSPWNRQITDDQGHSFKVLDLEISSTPATRDPETKSVIEHNLKAIAVRNAVIAACLALDNQVLLMDSETGDVKQKLSIPSPKSVAFDSTGGLLVLSNGQILRLALDGKTVPFTAATYADGQSLSVDTAGNVYLSVRGTDQNVKVFSPSGKLVREIGVRGGRPSYGVYNENGMLNPAQIAVDPTGRLWVTEENQNPKRTSVWDAKTGALVKDLAGTTPYCAAGAINPDDPTMGFINDTVYKIDWKTGTSKPVYSLSHRDLPNDLFPPKVMDNVSRVANHGKFTYVYAHNGVTTLYDGKTWRSASSVGQVKRVTKKRNASLNPLISADPFSSPLFDGHDGQSYSWSDRNGDGLVQSAELAFADVSVDGKPLKQRRFYWGSLADSSGTYAFIADGTKSLVRYRVTGYTECGAPIYDVAKPDVVPVGDLLGKGNGEGMIACGDDGRIYLNQNPILGVDKSGKVLGTYPNKFTSVHGSHDAGAAHAGYVIGPSSFLGTANFGGEIGEVFDLNGNLGENYLFTGDGLLIQTLFKDLRAGFDIPTKAIRGQAMDTITGGGESFGGNFIKTRDGHVYLTIGQTDARVLEVTGLDTVIRVKGSVAVTASQRDEAVKLAAASATGAAQAKVYEIARTATPPANNGKLDQWPELTGSKTTAIAIQIDDSYGAHYGQVAARYDDTNLYLAYRVNSRYKGIRNAGQDEHLMFKAGDAVDIMLGPEPQNGLAGDIRLLMTIKQGSPIAVINIKQDPTASKGLRYEFTSPARRIPFDRVQTVTDVQFATSPTPDGYAVTAAIPWKLLNIAPRAGLKLRGDFGILFADNGGTTTVSRQYWSNKETGLVNDVPGEGDITPARWGLFVLK
ncbi:MAG TPA: FlgD immunoglobulin-like domain containing protein [Capsulimonadaceae bacterium]|jgi:hypothetical protein